MKLHKMPYIPSFPALFLVMVGLSAAEKSLTFKVNDVLKKRFLDANMLLVDYKLEFGRSGGQIVLGDEFSPDGCRIWDRETRKKMDKDRFRQGLGDVIETYEEVGRRLGIRFD